MCLFKQYVKLSDEIASKNDGSTDYDKAACDFIEQSRMDTETEGKGDDTENNDP